MKRDYKTTKTSGFTLMEIMVTLFISVLLTSGVIKTYLFFGRTVNRRLQANNNLAQTRYFSQFFTQRIKAAQKSTLSQGDAGNLLSFTRYLDASNLWVNATLQYRPSTKDLIYTSGGTSRSLLTETEPLSNNVFFIENGLVHCRLRVGEQPELSVILDLFAKPRNL